MSGSSASDPVAQGAAITPNDSTDLTRFCRAIYVGGSGNLKVTLLRGDVVTFTDLASGIIHPIQAKRIWSTGTTATNILAFYDQTN
jgi:hypothetical protein